MPQSSLNDVSKRGALLFCEGHHNDTQTFFAAADAVEPAISTALHHLFRDRYRQQRYNFDARADQIDVIGFLVSDFGAVQAHMQNDMSGNAVIELGDGQSITLQGVSSSSLTASNFAFNLEPPLNNTNTMSTAGGALLPMGGDVYNTGTVPPCWVRSATTLFCSSFNPA